MSDQEVKKLSLRQRAQQAMDDYIEQMFETERKKKRAMETEFMRKLRSVDILEDEQIEISAFRLSNQWECPSAVIDGLRFIGYGHYGDEGPELSVRLLGNCSRCGQETMSDSITSLVTLASEIKSFTPYKNHDCYRRPAIEEPNSENIPF